MSQNIWVCVSGKVIIIKCEDWIAASLRPTPLMRTERLQRRGMRGDFQMSDSVSNLHSIHVCPVSGHQIPDPLVIVSRFPGSWSWSLVTAVILTPSWSWHWWQCHDSVMSSSTCPHPVCTLSINTLLLTPLHTKCLLFTLLYYTSNLFTRYLFSQAFVLCNHQPIRSQCWLSLTNEGAGPDVIVTLHNIGSLTFSHSQTGDHQSLNKYKQFAGSGSIHFQFPFILSLSVISPRHAGRKTRE